MFWKIHGGYFIYQASGQWQTPHCTTGLNQPEIVHPVWDFILSCQTFLLILLDSVVLIFCLFDSDIVWEK